MIVLDTNVVSALMRAQADAVTRAWLDRQAADSIWTTAVSVFELRAGIELLPAGRRRERLDRTLAAVLAEDLVGRILPFDKLRPKKRPSSSQGGGAKDARSSFATPRSPASSSRIARVSPPSMRATLPT